MIGTLLGSRYELLEKIGEGGMAEVYKARCQVLNRYVAVKILREEYSNNIDFMDKFKREATAVASLSANNIVNVYDVGTDRDINYIVMELVRGKTLKQYIVEKGRLTSGEIIDIGIQIAKALECAHKNNIIHRDIKPHNILVTEDGIVKVTDFGIAKASSNVTMTNTSKVMGSAHYFSPEQAKGSFVDFRTDIYSFGIVLYEMAVGRVPYDADSAVSVAIKHIQEPIVPPKQLNNNIPESLNRLIIKAMEKEPIKRYQTARDILLDLQRIKNDYGYKVVTNNYENEYTRVMDPIKVDSDNKGNTREHPKYNTNNNYNEYNSVNDFKKANKVYDDEDEYDEDESKESKSTSRNKKIVIMSVTAVLIVIIAIIGGYVLKKGSLNSNNPAAVTKGEVEVPKIKDLLKEQAETLVKNKGLIFVEAKQEKSDKPVGTVLECFPEEGMKVKPNTEVRVTVSSGPQTVPVPRVKELDINTAKQLIINSGFKVGNITEDFSSIAKGTVLNQSIEADTEVAKGESIDLVISKGEEVKLSKVPNLMDISVKDAERLLKGSKLTLGTKREIKTSTKSEDGKIFAQSIEVDTEVKEGTTVNISYYKYEEPKIEKVKVPQFMGKTIREARELASVIGINVGVEGNDEDVIESQDIEAGTKVDKGSTVTLTAAASSTDTPTEPITPQ